MKRLYIPLFFLVLSCNLEETNINPNAPGDVPMRVLLPPAQQRLADVYAGDAAVIAGIFSNYFTGFDALVQPLDRYVVDNNFFMQPVWSDLYTDVLPTFNLISRKATDSDSPWYEGVSKTLQALSLGVASDLWGDIPYSQAFLGAENLNPAFDDQELIYQSIQSLLDEAILALEQGESLFEPASDDLLLGGDRAIWLKTAHTLKARYYLHTVKRDPQAAQKALDHLASGIQSEGEALVYPYNEMEFNPWYRYLQATPNIRVDDDFLDLIDDDPRESYLVKKTFGEAFPGPGVAGQFSPLYLASFWEARFLLAEARLRAGQGSVSEALEEAVRSHMQVVSEGEIPVTEIDDYLAAQVQLTGNPDADLAIILREKYIAAFPDGIQAWTDYRRTGLPVLVANPDGDNGQNPGGAIPRRFPYPLNEILYNASIPDPQPTMQDRFWWDK